MNNPDLLMKMEEGIFSYRVAGILLHQDAILLQHPKNREEYAFPGGHVALFETSSEALQREFQEELHCTIQVNQLSTISENFFPWGKKQCHQLCLYYHVQLVEPGALPLEGSFEGEDGLCFTWIPLTTIQSITLYPPNVVNYIHQLDHIHHFIYQE